MINLSLFLLMGLAGIVITIIICVTGEKKKEERQDDVDFGCIAFLKFTVSVILILYVFRFVMMFVTGMFSGLVMPVIVGGLFAVIPLFLIVLTGHKKYVKSRV